MKRTLREVVAPMTFKEKVDYIWGYYKVRIVVCFLLLLAIGYTVYEVNARREVYINVFFVGQFISEETIDTLREQVTDGLIPKDQQDDKEISIQQIQYEDASVEEIQRFLALITARIIDILIIDEELFQEFQEQGLFLPLNDLNGFNNLQLDEEDIVQEESTNNIYGLRINDIEIFNNVAGSDERIVSVLRNSENQEEVMEFLQFVFLREKY